MKPLARISLFLFVFFFVLLLGYFLYGEFYTKKAFEDPEEKQFTEDSKTYISEEDAIITDTSKTATLSCNTEYVVINYDLNDDSEREVIEKLPGKYIGFERKDLEDEFRIYSSAPSLADEKKGLQNIELVSFSDEKVVVRKNYYIEPLPEKYIVVVEDNLLTIYYKDFNTIYLNTDIMLEDLPEKVQLEIMQIKTFDSEEELYNFLESYTS